MRARQDAGSQQPAGDTQAAQDLPPGLEAYSSRDPHPQRGPCYPGSVSFFPFSRGSGERQTYLVSIIIIISARAQTYTYQVRAIAIQSDQDHNKENGKDY